jgi:putative DNA primase/helicase
MIATANGHPPTKPQAPDVNAGAIPALLRAIARWLCWDYTWDAAEAEWDKPTRTAAGRPASSTNPATWCSFPEALAAYRERGFSGVGFVLVRPADGEDGIVGIDLDDCRDAVTGDIDEWAAEIVRELNTYTEVSPSGTGLRLFCLERKPEGGCRKGKFEMYSWGRYVTVTGQHLAGTPTEVGRRQAEMEAVHTAIFGVPGAPADTARGGAEPSDQDDAEVVRRAGEARNGEKFRRLWEGDTTGYTSASEADLALCSLLRFHCGRDPRRIDSLFRRSGLMRPKWEREDYRGATINKALPGEVRGENGQHGHNGHHHHRGTAPPPRNGTTTEERHHHHNGKAGGQRPVMPEELQGDCWHEEEYAREQADPCAEMSAAEEEVTEADDDCHRLARLFLADHTTTDGRAVHYWREEFHEWDGAAYRVIPEKEMQARLCQRIKQEFDRLNRLAVRQWEDNQGANDNGKPVPKPVAKKVTARLTSDVKHALAGLCLLPSTLETPAWVGGPECIAPFAASGVVACRNALLYLPGFADGRDCRVAPTPRFFSPNALDYDFDPDAPPPRAWLEFLGKLWPDDPRAVGALQEWFGYCLLPDTSQQKILMIVGPKRSGKGTIARVLRGLVGLANTAGPTLAGLGTNFGLWPLLDKTLAIISDARLSGRSDAAVIVERLLSISGEDAQTVDRKNMRPVTAKLAVRFVILTNELPKLNDPSGALVGRMVLLRQTQSWYGKEDPHLTEKLLAELPGILLWAIGGWRRLRERGRFEQPESGLKLVRELEDLSSPIGAFIREHCVIGPGLETPVRSIFDRWRRWCESVGRRETGTEQTFGRDLRAAVPGLDDRQPRQSDGRRYQVYVGIGLQAEEASW